MNGNSSSIGGIGCIGAMFLIFLTLKLIGLIDWPWIWVVSPLWITAVLVFLLFAFALILKALNR